jgi:hypothetical protein
VWTELAGHVGQSTTHICPVTGWGREKAARKTVQPDIDERVQLENVFQDDPYASVVSGQQQMD